MISVVGEAPEQYFSSELVAETSILALGWLKFPSKLQKTNFDKTLQEGRGKNIRA